MDRKTLFRLLARINKSLLPKQWDRDLSRLPKWRKALAAYRYWVTRNALD
ncbi:MAG: SsrA-binding protein [Flavobacteriales bacterium]